MEEGGRVTRRRGDAEGEVLSRFPSYRAMGGEVKEGPPWGGGGRTTGEGELVIRWEGEVTQATVPGLWREWEALGTGGKGELGRKRWVVDAGGVTRMDSAGLALLVKLRCQAGKDGAALEVRGLAEGYRRLLDRFDSETLDPSRSAPAPAVVERLAEQVGRTTAQMGSDLREQVAFIGELAVALVRAAVRPWTVRGRDFWLSAERSGVDALPIVVLISGLVGLVLSFQAAMAMRPYGAEIYVANLVTLAMLRELGPLMTAIILAGRSGGAFAAELGTMKVNDEISALSTMGLQPVAFLVVPRVLGLMVTIPLLTLFANLAGVAGGSVMFLTLDYPLSAYFRQSLEVAELRHLLSGLVKSVAFGVTLAGVGCLRGLRAGRGPSAVGQATTSAVVTSILLIVVIDAVLGTVFYFLGF